MYYIYVIIALALGYLVGSIPWALIIGQVFYHKDIRNYGSGNLGGTNAGRVLGKKAGIAVIVLDALKGLIMMIIMNFIYHPAVPFVGLGVIIGHSFPLFANFKGGKGVASAFGYLLGLAILGFGDIFFTFIYPLLFFILILAIFKMVSLASIVSLSLAALIAFITNSSLEISILLTIQAIFVIIRHIPNIIRIINHNERKVTWIK